MEEEQECNEYSSPQSTEKNYAMSLKGSSNKPESGQEFNLPNSAEKRSPIVPFSDKTDSRKINKNMIPNETLAKIGRSTEGLGQTTPASAKKKREKSKFDQVNSQWLNFKERIEKEKVSEEMINPIQMIKKTYSSKRRMSNSARRNSKRTC